MKLILSTVLVFCLVERSFQANSKHYIGKNVTFPNEEAGILLSGILTYPRNLRSKKKIPCFVLAHGSGGNDRDQNIYGNKIFATIGNYLSQYGSVILRYDERGIGKSTGNFYEARDFDFAKDVLAGIKFLKTFEIFKKCKYGVIGHSKGGITAMIVSSMSNDIQQIVLLGSPGMNGEEALHLQIAAIARFTNPDEEYITKIISINRKLYSLVKGSETKSEKTEKLTSILQNQLNMTNAEYIKAQLGQLLMPWFQDLLLFDQNKYLSNLKIPILGLWGSKGVQVIPQPNIAGIKAALEIAGNHDYELVVLGGLNHLFQSSKTGNPSEYENSKEKFSPKVLKIMKDWITRTVL